MRSPVPVYRIEQTHHTQVIAGQYIVVTDLALPSSPRRRLLAAAAALVKPIEDDAERAVRAGLGLADAVSKVAIPGGEALFARVGIATGAVVVGDLIGGVHR